MMNLEEGRIRRMRVIEDIGDNLMLDILSRLDVRTIIYCKCVCKKWHDLVLDPYFVNNMWPKNPNNLSLMIHDVTLTDTDVLNWVEIEEEYFDVARILTVDLSTPREINRFLVGGSVECLICVWSTCHTAYIINPVTKEYMSLPDAPSSNTRHDTTFGFGVSMGARAYKLQNKHH
ncbi:F-box associated domain containing protein [Tanacetum coccineum]